MRSPVTAEPPSSSWVADSGTNVHIVGHMSLLHSPRVLNPPAPLHLAPDDGCFEVVAVESVCILNGKGEALWLHHVSCVSSGATSFVSNSAAFEGGQ